MGIKINVHNLFTRTVSKSIYMLAAATIVFTTVMNTVYFLIPQKVQAAAELNFTELATHPQAAAQPTSTGQTINKLEIFDGKLLAAYGDYSDNTGPIDINPFDLGTNTFDGPAISVPTESLGNWKIIDGKLYTTTIDPTCAATCPAGYAVYTPGLGWEAKTPVDAEHIFAVDTLTGTDIWLFGSAYGSTSTAWRSIDGGDTFQVAQTYASDPDADNTERYYWGAALNNKMYMQSSYIESGPIQVFDGADWSTISPANTSQNCPSIHAVAFNNKIICDGQSGDLSTLNDQGWQTIGLSGELGVFCKDITCTGVSGSGSMYDGTDLQVLDDALYYLAAFSDEESSGPVTYLTVTSNLENWLVFEGLPDEARSFTIDKSTNKIYVGTTDSKIYVADMPSQDTSPPEVSVTAPANGSTINDLARTFQANASDDGFGVSKVIFYLNGQAIGEDTAAPYTVDWQNAIQANGEWRYQNGDYTLTAVAYDYVGNHSESDTISVHITVPEDITVSALNLGGQYGALAMTFDESQENIWFVSANTENESIIGRLNIATGDVTNYETGITSITAGRTAATSTTTGIWFVFCEDDQAVLYNINQANGSFVHTLETGMACGSDMTTIETDDIGNIWVVAPFASSEVVKVDSNLNMSTVSFGSDMLLASTISNQGILTVETYSGDVASIIEVDPDSNKIMKHELGAIASYGLAQDAENNYYMGNIFVDVHDFGLYKITPGSSVIPQSGFDGVSKTIFSERANKAHSKLLIRQWNGMSVLYNTQNNTSTAYPIEPLITLNEGGIYGSDLIADNGDMYIGGYATPMIYKITVSSDQNNNEDTDGDSIPNAVENAGPNNGDGNDDGTLDSAQSNVTTFIHNLTGKYMTIVAAEGVVITTTTVNQVNSSEDYVYPLGLASFTLNNVANGSTQSVSIYFHDSSLYSPSAFMARKYNTLSDTSFKISSASITKSTINSQDTITLSYQITDGGVLDQDSEANGTIVDPVGLAITNNLASTGGNIWAVILVALSLVFSAAATLYRCRSFALR